MYIPLPPSLSRAKPAPLQHPRLDAGDATLSLTDRITNFLYPSVLPEPQTGPGIDLRHLPSLLRKRDTMQNQSVIVGVVVGIVLLAFLIGVFYFLHRYGRAIRFTRRRRHRHGSGSGSSKGSHISSDMGPPPPPPPPG